MRIVTLTCPECGTVVAGNLLLEARSAECPGVGCEEVLRFEQLSADERAALQERRGERQ